jgi:hypothetical protein
MICEEVMAQSVTTQGIAKKAMAYHSAAKAHARAAAHSRDLAVLNTIACGMALREAKEAVGRHFKPWMQENTPKLLGCAYRYMGIVEHLAGSPDGKIILERLAEAETIDQEVLDSLADNIVSITHGKRFTMALLGQRAGIRGFNVRTDYPQRYEQMRLKVNKNVDPAMWAERICRHLGFIGHIWPSMDAQRRSNILKALKTAVEALPDQQLSKAERLNLLRSIGARLKTQGALSCTSEALDLDGTVPDGE